MFLHSTFQNFLNILKTLRIYSKCTYKRFPVHQKMNIPIGCTMRCEHDKRKQQQKLHKRLGERPREPTD